MTFNLPNNYLGVGRLLERDDLTVTIEFQGKVITKELAKDNVKACIEDGPTMELLPNFEDREAQ